MRHAMFRRPAVASRNFASMNLQDDAAASPAAPQLTTPLTDGTVDPSCDISALDVRAFCDATTQPASALASGADQPFLIPSVTETGVDLATTELWRNTQWAIESLDWVHMTSGLPWWATIVGCTVAVRALMLPLAIKTIRNGVNLQHANPHLTKMRDQMAAKPPSTPAESKMWANKQRALFAKYDCNPMAALAMPLIQMPVFMTFFFSLREMVELYPSMATGGMGWFTDLTVQDPYFLLPVISSLTFYAIIELGAEGAVQTNQSAMMKKFMKGLAVVMIPATYAFPTGVFMYWVTSNFFSLGQTALFKIPALKKALNIKDPPTPAPGAESKSENPFSKVLAMAKKQAQDGQDTSAALPPPPPPVQETFAHKPRKKRKKGPRH